jgi:hypothetical protein
MPKKENDFVWVVIGTSLSSFCSSSAARKLLDESLIVLASSHLNLRMIESCRPLLESALREGKTICISWGQDPNDGAISTHRESLRLIEDSVGQQTQPSASSAATQETRLSHHLKPLTLISSTPPGFIPKTRT